MDVGQGTAAAYDTSGFVYRARQGKANAGQRVMFGKLVFGNSQLGVEVFQCFRSSEGTAVIKLATFIKDGKLYAAAADIKTEKIHHDISFYRCCVQPIIGDVPVQ